MCEIFQCIHFFFWPKSLAKSRRNSMYICLFSWACVFLSRIYSPHPALFVSVIISSFSPIMKSCSKWYSPSRFSTSKDGRFGFLLWLSGVTASPRGLVAVLEESRSSNDMEHSARCDDIDRLKLERWRSLGLFRTLPSLYSSPFSGDKYSANVCQSVTAERLPVQPLTLSQSDGLAASARVLMLTQIF